MKKQTIHLSLRHISLFFQRHNPKTAAARKRIAMATLEKTNVMIRESSSLGKEEGQAPMAQQEFVALS